MPCLSDAAVTATSRRRRATSRDVHTPRLPLSARRRVRHTRCYARCYALIIKRAFTMSRRLYAIPQATRHYATPQRHDAASDAAATAAEIIAPCWRYYDVAILLIAACYYAILLLPPPPA